MRRHLGLVVVAGGLWAAAGRVCAAQSAPASAPSSPNSAPCTVAPQPVPCSTTAPAAKPNTADKFPFPGGDGGNGDAANPPAANAPGSGSDSATPQAPGETGADAAKKPSGGDHPFPEDDTKKPLNLNGAPGSHPFPEEDTTPGGSGAGSSSSSSSSSGDDPSADPDAAGLKDKGSEGSQTPPGRHLLHRVNPIGTKLLTSEEREAEDLDVAQFYAQTGNLQAAYLRNQDAVKTAPDDPDAHFALAAIALKLNKRDEAIAEYTACLKHDPDDKEAKAARKELARLKP